MLKHFDKLHSPIKPALTYQSLDDQRLRFVQNGWAHVVARSLWDLWSNESFISLSERSELDNIEPFDEWEELACFASHYFLLTATVEMTDAYDHGASKGGEDRSPTRLQSAEQRSALALRSDYGSHPMGRGCRRYGASYLDSKSRIVHHGGHGLNGRLSDFDEYVHPTVGSLASKQQGPPAREVICHTVTELADGSRLLAGGRTSPDHASPSCFLCKDRSWCQVAGLPRGTYRHGATPFQSGVLVYGGRHDSRMISDDWIFWALGYPWRKIEATGDTLGARFGFSMVLLEPDSELGKRLKVNGLVSGGIGHERRVLSDLYGITMHKEDEGSFHIECENLTPRLRFQGVRQNCFGRFGGKMITRGSHVLILGGVGASGVIPQENEILRLDASLTVSCVKCIMRPRPLLLGFEIQKDPRTDSLLLFGGGAVCFSFGTCWNRGLYEITSCEVDHVTDSGWRLLENNMPCIDETTVAIPKSDQSDIDPLHRNCKTSGTLSVKRKSLASAEDFVNIKNERNPLIFEGLDMGPCVRLWTTDYLKGKIGSNHTVRQLRPFCRLST